MYAFILLSLALALISLDVAGSSPPPDAWNVAGGAALAALGVFLAGLALGGYIVWRRGALDRDEQRFLRKVRLLGKAYRLLVVAAYAFILFPEFPLYYVLPPLRWVPAASGWTVPGLGWSAVAAHAAGGMEWFLPAVAVAVAPLVALLALAWMALFWADRALRVALFERAGAAVGAAQWTLPRYLEFMFRQYLLVVLVPLLVLVGIYGALTVVLGSPDSSGLAAALFLAAVIGSVLLAGPWLRVCWRTEALPEGDLRRRLYAMAGRAGIRIANVLVWRTNLSIANGLMIGLAGPVRYIMISDALLLAMSQSPEEVEAVFAHEVGHVKYGHTRLYMALALGGISLAFLAGEAAGETFNSVLAANLATAAALLVYWWFGFGYVSRRCELEADLYAVRATECPVACSAPDPGFSAGTSLRQSRDNGWGAAAAGQGPCEHRIVTFVGALRRISRLNGSPPSARGWRHFSVSRRSAILLGLLANPADLERHEHRLRRVKTAALLVSLTITAFAVGTVTALEVSEPYHPEHPARPKHVRPEKPTYLARFVDGNQVDVIALGPPQFDRYADAVADLDDGRLPRCGRHAAAAHDDVAVADPRRHAVAVDAQGERARPERAEARQVQELEDPAGRRLG
jgi:Zn-dependent protease with chaperone function